MPTSTLRLVLDSMHGKLIATQEDLLRRLTDGNGGRIQTVNLHHMHLANTDARFRAAIEDADAVTADGWPIVAALRRLGGHEVQRVTGSQMVADMLAADGGGRTVGILGASKRTGDVVAARLAVRKWRVEYQEHGIAVCWRAEAIAEQLVERGIDILLIAVTPPTGDLLGQQIRKHGFGGVVINVGGALDMAAGVQRRAPAWVAAVRAEWLYRLATNPRRLARRYLIEGPPTALALFCAVWWRRDRRAPIRHVGLVGDQPGGMAQVVNGYLRAEFARSRHRALRTARHKHDRRGPVLWLVALVRTALLRLARPVPLLVAHLSEGGSFVREGSIVLLAHALGVPTAVQLHGAHFVEFAKARPRLVRAVLGRTGGILVLTRETAETVDRLAADDARLRAVPLHRIRNAVPIPPAPDLAAKRRQILFCGAIGYRKGVDVLLDAWTKVHEELGDWQLLVVGPRDPSFSVPDLPRLEVRGAVSHNEVLRLMTDAAVAVLPSRNEALPMFLLEAMARGCAPIATRVGDIGQLLGDGAGVLLAPGEFVELAQALLDVCHDDAARVDMGRRARQRVVDRHCSDAVFAAVEDIWLGVRADGGR
jgi:exopolysaccharide biosynthesis WecB/TagA/CpsF family protein